MELQKLSKSKREVRSYQPSPDLVDNRTMLGVEFELEGFHGNIKVPDTVKALYEHKRDGSLGDSGMEFVFRAPLFGKDLVQALEDFCDYATKAKFESNHRTSIHVHMDVRDMDVQQLGNLCVVYALLERSLFEFTSQHRSNNIFCLAWHNAEAEIINVAALIRSPSEKKSLEILASCNKYSALNICPIRTFGSIEFRHLETTFNSEKLLDWCNMILSMKSFAQNFPYQHASGLMEDYSMLGARALCEKILGVRLTEKLQTINFEENIFRGMRLAQDVGMYFEYDYRELLQKQKAEPVEVTSDLFRKYLVRSKKELRRKGTEEEFLKDMQAAGVEYYLSGYWMNQREYEGMADDDTAVMIFNTVVSAYSSGAKLAGQGTPVGNIYQSSFKELFISPEKIPTLAPLDGHRKIQKLLVDISGFDKGTRHYIAKDTYNNLQGVPPFSAICKKYSTVFTGKEPRNDDPFIVLFDN